MTRIGPRGNSDFGKQEPKVPHAKRTRISQRERRDAIQWLSRQARQTRLYDIEGPSPEEILSIEREPELRRARQKTVDELKPIGHVSEFANDDLSQLLADNGRSRVINDLAEYLQTNLRAEELSSNNIARIIKQKSKSDTRLTSLINLHYLNQATELIAKARITNPIDQSSITLAHQKLRILAYLNPDIKRTESFHKLYSITIASLTPNENLQAA